MFFFFKQKTAYGVRISDWSSDVCSADLEREGKARIEGKAETDVGRYRITRIDAPDQHVADHFIHVARDVIEIGDPAIEHRGIRRSEEHTSELQSLMRISYAVFCLKKKNQIHTRTYINNKTTLIPQYITTIPTHATRN